MCFIRYFSFPKFASKLANIHTVCEHCLEEGQMVLEYSERCNGIVTKFS